MAEQIKATPFGMGPSPTHAFEIWGLTGGIASGKSMAGRYFEEAGFPVLDADALSRELSAPGGAAHDKIVARFGTADRAKLREIVFKDVGARRDLEAILHPLIGQESIKRMHAMAEAMTSQGKKAHVIYEATLLVETGRYRQMSGLIVIDAPSAMRRARMIERDGSTPEMADRILAAQLSDEERRKAATVIIPNTGTPEDLRTAVQNFIRQQGWA
jgi:dephospho-CoA kinase